MLCHKGSVFDAQMTLNMRKGQILFNKKFYKHTEQAEI